MPIECEAKLRIDNIEQLRASLDKLGAASEGENLERNWVLDDSDERLGKNGILLRVRNVGGAGGMLTVKRPVGPGEFKSREEVETMVDSADELILQLKIVGFTVRWIYEKYRETWLWRDCILALDRCPEIGSFIEIEGTPPRIREVAADLGLDPEQHIGDSYLDLWQKHLQALGQPKRNMVFSDFEKNTRIITRTKY